MIVPVVERRRGSSRGSSPSHWAIPRRCEKGAFLIALGNSFNAAHDGNASASWGILSNIARKLELDRDEFSGAAPKTLGLVNYPTLLQLDSKLNLGMSGGAVINLKGELVGLTTMASSPSGFDALAGYAIPMDKIVRRAIATLKAGQRGRIRPARHSRR